MLEAMTLALALATIYLAYQTHRLASITSYFEEARLISERNWRLWETRNDTHAAVYPQNLGAEAWRWRITILSHLGPLFAAFRRESFGLSRLSRDGRLNARIKSAKRAFLVFAEDAVASTQLKAVLVDEEEFPSDFLSWLRDQGVYKAS